MKFDRMALSDCFDSTSLANEIRRQFNIGNEYAPLEDIAGAVGIWNIKEEALKSIEGALVVPDGKIEGEIILNSNQHPERKRFTLAHELGHFVHPLHHPVTKGRFNCSVDDIFKSFGRDEFPDIENQANEFASELLLPQSCLVDLIKSGCSLNFQHILDVCIRLKVSKAFAIRKLQPLCLTQVAFIFSHNGIIRYAQSDGFPFLKVWSKNNLPQNTFPLSEMTDNSVSEKVQVNCNIWLKKASEQPLYEQLLFQENGYTITMLTIG